MPSPLPPQAISRRWSRIWLRVGSGASPWSPRSASRPRSRPYAVALTSRLGPGADPALARAVFGDVVLAETWSEGWSVVTANPELRAVTPAGDLITAVGIDLALPQGASPAVLAAASAAAEQADVELARAESLHTSARRSFDLARHDERAALEALEAIETRLAGGAQASQRLEHARSARSDERQRLEQRLSAIVAEENERNNRTRSAPQSSRRTGGRRGGSGRSLGGLGRDETAGGGASGRCATRQRRRRCRPRGRRGAPQPDRVEAEPGSGGTDQPCSPPRPIPMRSVGSRGLRLRHGAGSMPSGIIWLG